MTASIRLAILGYLLGACASHSPVPDHVRPQKPHASVAEAALGAVTINDYRSPTMPTRLDALAKAVDLYVASCEGTKNGSDCVWAFTLSIDQYGPEWDARSARAIHVLVPLCMQSHDVDACRIFDGNALDFLPAYFDDIEATCKAGLLVACDALAHRYAPLPAAWALNEHSCEAGDWTACQTLEVWLHHDGKMDESKRMHVMSKAAAKAACSRGAPYACVNTTEKIVGEEQDAADRLAAPMVAQRCPRGYLTECLGSGHDERWPMFRCVRTGIGCEFLGDDDPIRTRDALETGCQFRRPETCVELVKGYRKQKFPEPVPGRGDAIAHYLCDPSSDLDKRPCDELDEQQSKPISLEKWLLGHGQTKDRRHQNSSPRSTISCLPFVSPAHLLLDENATLASLLRCRTLNDVHDIAPQARRQDEEVRPAVEAVTARSIRTPTRLQRARRSSVTST